MAGKKTDDFNVQPDFLGRDAIEQDRSMLFSNIKTDSGEQNQVRIASSGKKLSQIIRIGFLYLMLVFLSSTPCGFLAGFFDVENLHNFREAASGGQLFSIFASISYLGSAFGIFIAFVANQNRVMRSLSGILLIWLVVAFAIASTLWSLLPGITFSRSVALFGTTLAGVWLGLGTNAQGQIRLLIAGLTTVLFASLLMAVLAPSIAFDPHSRMLHGIFVQKNSLGWAAAISGILAMGALFGGVVRRSSGIIAFAIAIAAILASNSSAALVAVMMGCLIYFATSILRRSGRYWLITFISMIIVSIPILLVMEKFSNRFLGILGKDEKFNGRAQIWEALWPAINDRPLGGWGFSAFWNDPISGSYMSRVPGAIFASNAQGGYHEILINLGWIGLGLFLLAYAWILLGLIRQSSRGDSIAAIFVATLGSLAILGWTAPVLLAANLIYWLIITVAAIYRVRGNTYNTRNIGRKLVGS